MGKSGFSSALCHPQGFQPVEPIQKVLDEGHGFIEIEPNELPAVRQGRVYFTDADRWNWSDAMTRQKLLTALPKLLGASLQDGRIFQKNTTLDPECFHQPPATYARRPGI
ncbi:hypothetical protein [Paenibacillus brasilensis]|uniref:Uncharacterized protein n=1 Tax=Paenibacillus brasilensis TaxID=128574 RepID=A0ABU0KTW9_9BACL|nr:hypothetical protein [Paenibacillus brasilensis]MDQ0492874.1 hypothetical protein [Paenibacillus brasilensis]